MNNHRLIGTTSWERERERERERRVRREGSFWSSPSDMVEHDDVRRAFQTVDPKCFFFSFFRRGFSFFFPFSPLIHSLSHSLTRSSQQVFPLRFASFALRSFVVPPPFSRRSFFSALPFDCGPPSRSRGRKERAGQRRTRNGGRREKCHQS